MRLLIDCGNTRIKWALATADAIVARGQAGHGAGRHAAIQELALVANRQLESIHVASVLDEAFTAALLAALGPKARRLAVVPEAHGVRIAYRDPAALGVDRWLAMIAAKQRFAATVCVVSAGTAVTFDAVDETGLHLGGFIWPGPQLVAESLARGTDRIGTTPVAGAMPAGIEALGRDTGTAVGNGSLLAVAAAVDRAARIVRAATAGDSVLLLTGGDAKRLVPWLESQAVVEPDLVFEAMRIVAGPIE